MILTTLLAAASLCASPTMAQVGANTSAPTAEGAEILRRILVDALANAFARKVDEKNEGSATSVKQLHRLGVVTTLWADRETIQHSRVFHLPEVGLFFALDAALPVVSKEPEKHEPGQADRPRDDEWERARRELRGDWVGGEGNVFLRRFQQAQEAEIDPQAIEQVIDQVLKALARHAVRIEGLAQKETITVALRLSGRSPTLWSSFASGENDEGTGQAHVWSSEPEGELAQGMYSIALAGGTSAREQNLVIRVALADLAGFSEGGLERLRQRAQINRY